MRLTVVGLVLFALPGLSAAAEYGKDQPALVLNTGGHSATVRRIVFTPDGKQLISVGDDKTIRFWSTSGGELLRTLRPPIGPAGEGILGAAAISPDGKTLAVAGIGYRRDGAIQSPIFLISLEDYRIVRTLPAQAGLVDTLAFSPNGKILASGGGRLGNEKGGDPVIRLWDPVKGTQVGELKGHTQNLTGLAFDPDGGRLASSSYDRTARVWAVDTGKELARFGVGQTALGVAWSPDGKTIATGSEGRAFIKLWEPGGKLIRHLTNPREGYCWVHSLAFTADSKELLYSWVSLTGSEPGHEAGKRGAGLYTLADGKFRQAVEAGTHWNAVAQALSPNNELVATAGGNDHAIFLWKRQDGTVTHRLGGQGRTPFHVGWGPGAERPVLGWANADPRTGLALADGLLTAAFDLTELSFYAPEQLDKMGTPLKNFRQEQRHLGDLTVSRPQEDVRRVVVTEKDKPIAEIREPAPIHDFTLLPERRVVVSGTGYAHLYDLAHPEKPARVFHGVVGVCWAVALSPDGHYLAGCCQDQTIRIWKLDEGEPVLSLFVAGREWIAWTPEGYYAASTNGERFMGWQINNGLDALGTFYPAVQFHKTYFRPDVIALVLGKGGLPPALEATGAKETRATPVAEVLPPQVRITSPGQLSITAKEPDLKVEAEAESVGPHALVAVQLLVDGRPYQGNQGNLEAPKKGKVTRTWTVRLADLPAGPHRVQVVARSEASLAISDQVEVTYKAPTDGQPRLFVVAVGINNYDDEDLRLNFCVQDAQELASVLRERSLLKVEQVTLLLNKDATRERILKSLDDLKGRMTANDVAIFAYSGHGGNEDGRFFLVPVDFRGDNVKGTAVWGEELKDRLAKLPGRIVVFLDACHAGALGGVNAPQARAMLGADNGTRALHQHDALARSLADEGCGVLVMCAAMHNQFANENGKLKHGIFTKGLIEGLSGKADYNKNGKIHLTELDLYVDEYVATESKNEQRAVTAKPTSFLPFELTRVK